MSLLSEPPLLFALTSFDLFDGRVVVAIVVHLLILSTSIAIRQPNERDYELYTLSDPRSAMSHIHNDWAEGCFLVVCCARVVHVT